MVEFSFLATQLLNGLVVGMILVLVSLGLTLIFGLMGVVNFAHGDILLIGTYVTYAIIAATDQFWLALILAPLVVGLIGLIIERFALQFTYGKNPLLQLLLTFGIALILRELLQVIWGSEPLPVPSPSWSRGMLDLGLISFPIYRLFLVTITVCLIIALYIFITRTDIGMVIRAGTYDREMIDVMGINVSRIFTFVFVLGCAIAGFGGALIAPIDNAYPQLGMNYLIISFVVVIIGGLGSFKGTVIAGIIVGQIMVITGMIASGWSEVVIFMFMAIVLLVRPRGLFGQEGVFS